MFVRNAFSVAPFLWEKACLTMGEKRDFWFQNGSAMGRKMEAFLNEYKTKRTLKLNAKACVCIYAVELLSGPSLGFWEVIIWSKFVFFLKHRLPKNTIKIVVSAHFGGQKIARTKFWKLLSGPSWRFLKRTQLGRDNNFQLGPDNNFQKCTFFGFFLLLKMCQNTCFYSAFWESRKMAKNAQQKR